MATETKKDDALYGRYSSHSQDDGTSIEVQIESCERAAGGPCLRYLDPARTGRTIGGRPEFQRLMEDAETGRIGRLFVYKYDRLGRAAETHVLVAQLEELGVEVISATEGKESLSRGVHLVMAEYFSKALAERTRDGLCKRFEQGTFTGGEPPYGYKVVSTPEGKKKLAVDERESESVRQMIATYLDATVSVKGIASRLHEMGIPTRHGAQWSFTTIQGILRNRMLIGEIRFNQHHMKLNKETGLRIPVLNPEAKHMVSHRAELRIVDDETFALLQEKINARARKHHGARVALVARAFTGRLFCGVCGSVFYSKKSKNDKGEYYYYNCGTRQRKGLSACSNASSIREDQLIEIVNQITRSIFTDADKLITLTLRDAEQLMATNQTRTRDVRSQIGVLDREVRELTRLIMDSEISLEAKRAVSRQMGEKEAARMALEGTLANLTQNAQQGAERLVAEVRKAVEKARHNFAGMNDPHVLNRFVEDFIGPITVTVDGRLEQAGNQTETAPANAGAVVPINVAGASYGD